MSVSHTREILKYDRLTYPFSELVAQHFSVKTADLACLHNLPTTVTIGRLEVGKDQQTPFHSHFYTIGEDFWQLYQKFVRDELLKDRAGDFYYQKRPTFRVQLPMNVATGGFHKDADYNHSPDECNYVIPLTQMFGTNAIWIESQPDKGDFTPATMGPGEYLRFHGAVLTHGSYLNLTGRTRVSMDFRLIAKDRLKYDGERTVNLGVPLQLGSYYSEFSS